MVIEKTYAEFSGKKDATPGFVYCVDAVPIVQLCLYDEDGTYYTSEKRYLGAYTLFWRARTTAAQAQAYMRDIIRFRDGDCAGCTHCCTQQRAPVQVAARYHYVLSNQNGKNVKRLYWFLGAEARRSLDVYDRGLQKIHDRFISEYGGSLYGIHYTVGNLRSIVVQATGSTGDPQSVHAPELEFYLHGPLFPKDVFAKAFKETSMVAGLTDEEVAAIFDKAEAHVYQLAAIV